MAHVVVRAGENLIESVTTLIHEVLLAGVGLVRLTNLGQQDIFDVVPVGYERERR